MNLLAAIIVITANILGSFDDPFEFEGNYGYEVNQIREAVFNQIVSKEALAKQQTDFQIVAKMKQSNPTPEEINQFREQLVLIGQLKDKFHGPTLNELVPDELMVKLREESQLSEVEIQNLLRFLERYKNVKVFQFFRNNPKSLLSLDKGLMDKALLEGKRFDLPILSSTTILEGKNSTELKSTLMDALFVKEVFSATKDCGKILKEINNLDSNYLKQYFGPDAENAELVIFSSPGGQVFFYWLYQSLNLHLISESEKSIADVNSVKKIFLETLGNPVKRAELFTSQLINSDASILFTQESDSIVRKFLTEDKDLFYSIDGQKMEDGTFVFLRKDFWNPDFQVVPMDSYLGYERGRINAVLATASENGGKFLLVSGHGSSTRAEDGRLQISKIVEKYQELKRLPENENLQLIIGMDANTKSKKEVKLFREHLDSLGLVATDLGPTTMKKRMVTVQHGKAARVAMDEEDYLIVLKPDNDGSYQLTDEAVGFDEVESNIIEMLPNSDNPSDHYPVRAILVPIW